MTIFVGSDEILKAYVGADQLPQMYVGDVPLLGGVSPEAQAVLDQMVALSPTEEGAIITFVDGLVADGIWDFVLDCWAPCLNATDFNTDFKNVAGVQTAIDANWVHTPGEGIEFTQFNAGSRCAAILSSVMNANPSGAGAYVVYTLPDTTGNTDYFGCADGAVLECYARWRGTDTTDLNIAWSHTGTTPRPPAGGTRPGGDVIQAGSGASGLSAYFFDGPTQLASQARTFEGGWPTEQCQFNGRNNLGASQQGRESVNSFWFLLQGHDPDTDCLPMRARVLQFLRDIGVTGVPAT